MADAVKAFGCKLCEEGHKLLNYPHACEEICWSACWRGVGSIYARMSSDAEGTGLGAAWQLEDCRKLAADRGWPVGAEYVDNDVSAFSGNSARELCTV